MIVFGHGQKGQPSFPLVQPPSGNCNFCKNKPLSTKYQIVTVKLYKMPLVARGFCSRKCKSEFKTRLRHLQKLDRIVKECSDEIAELRRAKAPEATVQAIEEIYTQRVHAEAERFLCKMNSSFASLVRTIREANDRQFALSIFDVVVDQLARIELSPSKLTATINAAPYTKGGSMMPRYIQPSPADFVTEVGIALKRELPPTLWAFFDLVFLQRKYQPAEIPTKTFDELREACAEGFRRHGLHPKNYFRPKRVELST